MDTIAAIATPAGRGGVGILRLSGPSAFAIAHRIAGELPPPRTAALRDFRDAGGETIDRGLVLAFPAPRSFTGEDVVELHAHGGPVLLDLLLRAACAHGARIARPGEFSERAFLNDRLDLAQAEGIADLIDASSRDAVLAARRSLDGEFSTRVQALAQAFLDLRVFVEGALDFSDEDIDWLSDAALQAQLHAALDDLRALRADAAQGRRLREGLVVAIAGRPNSGKSTLLNRLAGAEAAIVSDIPGTTRDTLREHLVVAGMPVTVVDTAGLRETRDPIEAEGIRRTWQALERSELAIYVADDREGVTHEDRVLLARLPAGLARLVVLNKCDLTARPAGPETAAEDLGACVRLSAATGAGLDALRTAIAAAAGMGAGSEGVFSARARHIDALARTQAHADTAARWLSGQGAAELVAEELRLAHDALGEITGRVTTEDLLGAVFSRFCIGK